MPVSKKVLQIVFIIAITFLLINCTKKESPQIENPISHKYSFGLIVDSLIEVHGTINKGETLGDILIPHGITDLQIHNISIKSRDIQPVHSLKAGSDYYIYAKWDTTETVSYFVYVRNPIEYVVFDLTDSVNIYSGKKDVVIKERIFASGIKNSLWETLESNNIDAEVAIKLSEIYAWQIDFFRIDVSDSFKVVYEQLFVDDKPTGIGKILTASFLHRGEDFYAFRFDNDDNFDYYDEKGLSLRKAFLKAPLKFSRISSRFSMRRFHPILKRVKSHLGTDYSAPYGTPIMSTGDGIVSEASYTSGNGNYVKIKHNSTYTTQYLHMSKFAKGIRPGIAVKQGQIIGYVGSTGLATGPHVCYRFWKNNRQVDPLHEKMPSTEPIAQNLKDEFNAVKDSLVEKLLTPTMQ